MKNIVFALVAFLGLSMSALAAPAAGESNTITTQPQAITPFAGYGIGVYGTHQFHGASNGVGIIGTAPITNFIGIRGYAERSFPTNQNRFGVEGQLNMPVNTWLQFSPHAGIAYISNRQDSQFQPVVGVEGEVLLTKHNAVFVDYSYQRATGSLGSLNGSRVSVGYRYLF